MQTASTGRPPELVLASALALSGDLPPAPAGFASSIPAQSAGGMQPEFQPVVESWASVACHFVGVRAALSSLSAAGTDRAPVPVGCWRAAKPRSPTARSQKRDATRKRSTTKLVRAPPKVNCCHGKPLSGALPALCTVRRTCAHCHEEASCPDQALLLSSG